MFAAAAVALLWTVLRESPTAKPPAPASRPETNHRPRAKRAQSRTPAPLAAAREARSDRDPESNVAANQVADSIAQLPFFDRDGERAFRWSQVDLDAVRSQLPENAFWALGAPTRDDAVLEERAERKARMNDAWGRVLSGNASQADIQGYYAERHRVSSDYVEFADHLLEHYGDVLPESDVGLLEFSSQIHRARLQQMPRRLMEALERKERQDQLREAWLADEAAFEQTLQEGGDPTVGPPDESEDLEEGSRATQD